MMKKNIRTLMRSTAHILMSFQMVFGALWMIGNFTKLPQFQESLELLSMSENLCVDEYTGFLYVLLIRLVGYLPGLQYTWLYVLQMLLAFITYRIFLKKAGMTNSGERIFYSLFLLTIPMILQCHMAVLPYSMASSVTLLLLGELLAVWTGKEPLNQKRLLVCGIWWSVASLFCPDYAWIVAIPMGFALLQTMWKSKKLVLKGVIALVCMGLVVGLLGPVTQTPGSMGKMQKSVGSTLLLRVVWPNFSSFQYFWEPRVMEVFSSQELFTIAGYPEKVIYEFGPRMEAAYGKEQANEIYMGMAKITFDIDTKNILKRVGADALSYLCPPLTMLVQLQGMGVSYTGWNYGKLKEYTPKLTEYYTDYALGAWILIGVLSILCYILGKEKKKSPRKTGDAWFFVVTIGTIVIWYTINSGSMQDYKKVILNSILCSVLLIKGITGVQSKKE